MFRSLHIQGYRRFKDYRLENLSRVNLLVGDNNSGKTSVLEAIHFLLSDDPHSSLMISAERRGEVLDMQFGLDDRRRFAELSHYFNGHEISTRSQLLIDSEERSRRLEISAEQLLTHDAKGPNDFSARIVTAEGDSLVQLQFGVARNGAFGTTTFGTWNPDAPKQSNVHILTGEIHAALLRETWDSLIRQRQESEVVTALSIVDDEIEDLHFDAALTDYSNPRVGVRFGHRDEVVRQPLGTLGDGVVRMLGIAVLLVDARDGTLLVDEIDNGFHWTRMADIWKFVIETARQTNTQVFATTHSEDCIKGLASVCSEHPELAEDVSLQSLKTALNFSVSVTGDRLPFVVGQEIEVR